MGAVGVTEGAGEDGDLLLIKLVLLFKSGVDFFPLLWGACASSGRNMQFEIIDPVLLNGP